MSESMREAVEGFERDQETRRQRVASGLEAAQIATEQLRESVEQLKRPEFQAAWEHAAKVIREDDELQARRAQIIRRFRRADVHDCITAANEQRQLAIASPKSAEQANALATRLADLAERIAGLLEEG